MTHGDYAIVQQRVELYWPACHGRALYCCAAVHCCAHAYTRNIDSDSHGYTMMRPVVLPGVDVIQGDLVLGNGEPIGDAQGLSMGDPVDGKFQVAAGCLSEDDRVVCGDGLESRCQAQGALVRR